MRLDPAGALGKSNRSVRAVDRPQVVPGADAPFRAGRPGPSLLSAKAQRGVEYPSLRCEQRAEQRGTAPGLSLRAVIRAVIRPGPVSHCEQWVEQWETGPSRSVRAPVRAPKGPPQGRSGRVPENPDNPHGRAAVGAPGVPEVSGPRRADAPGPRGAGTSQALPTFGAVFGPGPRCREFRRSSGPVRRFLPIFGPVFGPLGGAPGLGRNDLRRSLPRSECRTPAESRADRLRPFCRGFGAGLAVRAGQLHHPRWRPAVVGAVGRLGHAVGGLRSVRSSWRGRGAATGSPASRWARR
jgi:hypothetical protein